MFVSPRDPYHPRTTATVSKEKLHKSGEENIKNIKCEQYVKLTKLKCKAFNYQVGIF